MKQYKGVIFDLDGTLLNTIEDLGNSVNMILSKHGFPEHNINEYKMLVGNGMKNLVSLSFPEDKRQELDMDKMLEEFIRVYHQKYMEKTVPYPGIEQMLDNLMNKRIKMGINSNKRDDYSKALAQKLFGRIPFVDVFGERQHVPRKPDPRAALELAKVMGFDASEILYIGDSGTDMQTGKNAGMDTVGVLWGFRGSEELKKYRATYLVESPAQVVGLFL